MRLALYGQTINLGNLFIFHVLRDGSIKEKDKLRRLIEYLNTILDIYEKQHPKLQERKRELQLEIRLIAKGTPVTEPMSYPSANIEAYNSMSESQRNSINELLKKAYRACASLCHPDKGGNVEDFQDLRDAYNDKDLTRINALWLRLSKGCNLYWQSSEEGTDWAYTELARPQVRQEELSKTPLYEIVRNHASGRVFKANSLMFTFLRNEIIALENELNHLRNQHGNQRQKDDEEVGQESNQDRFEGKEGTDSVGESASGESFWEDKL